jgi:hypothetical protein
MDHSAVRPDFREVALDAADWYRYAERLGLVEGSPAQLLRDRIARTAAVVAPSGVGPVVVVLTRSDRMLLQELDQQDLDEWFAATNGGGEDPIRSAQNSSF